MSVWVFRLLSPSVPHSAACQSKRKYRADEKQKKQTEISGQKQFDWRSKINLRAVWSICAVAKTVCNYRKLKRPTNEMFQMSLCICNYIIFPRKKKNRRGYRCRRRRQSLPSSHILSVWAVTDSEHVNTFQFGRFLTARVTHRNRLDPCDRLTINEPNLYTHIWLDDVIHPMLNLCIWL